MIHERRQFQLTGQDHLVSEEPPTVRNQQRRSGRSIWMIGMIIATAIGWGVYGKLRQSADAAEVQAQTLDFRPTVRVVAVDRNADPVKLTLPGDIEAFDEATIFARATGYIAERRADIGSRVHAGDLLARIAAPDLDKQLGQAQATLDQRQAELRQAEAAVNQAQSNKDLADVTNGRIATLARQGWETAQNADQTRLALAAQDANLKSSQAGVIVAQANYQAQLATVQQLQELTGFERVVAPFDGVVTARNVDVGDLISGSASGGASMFTIQHDDVLRVHIDVPQSATVGLVDGLEAQVVLPELPNQVFHGVVARNAGALNAASRTMSAEIDVRNDKHLLHPGMFVNVTLGVPRAAPAVVVPSNAILFNGQGLRVATIEKGDTVKMRDVAIYRDFGTSVELRSGLSGDERIIINPPANLEDGNTVRVAEGSDNTHKGVSAQLSRALSP
jgi:HlyD family secretion protein